tara:strand:- start:24 stop:1886 length:1863 start_codon:yes stop_codon:yes gene_type:complete
MCGIVGYVGHRPASDLLLEGLSRLEYRGYDSAGIAVVDDSEIEVRKRLGRVAGLIEMLELQPVAGSIGIGHTRWATHGEASDINSHPHRDETGRVVIVHNGVIENYDRLKSELAKAGRGFQSTTDTEVVAQLIGWKLDQLIESGRAADDPETCWDALQAALGELKGTYGLGVLFRDCPGHLWTTRCGSPLVVGVGDHEFFLASDTSPLIGYTRDVVYLDDHDTARLGSDGIEVRHRDAGIRDIPVQTIPDEAVDVELGDYPHYMLKEIYEQPESIRSALRGRLNLDDATAVFGGLNADLAEIRRIDRIVLTACGTSWHAGLVGEYLLEEFARIPTEVEYASELRYRNSPLTDTTMVFAITQSGETADTLAAMRECRRKGHKTLAICNTVGSTIAREADGGIYLHAGPEIGVASTKAFTSQVTVLALLALYLGRMRHMSFRAGQSFAEALQRMPELISETLECHDKVRRVAMRFADCENFLYLGRQYNFPVALEGALKLKEISYIHAEGYPAAEMKHGPIALVDRQTPSVFVTPRGSVYEKVISNMEEIKARGGPVIAIAGRDDERIGHLADEVISVPDVPEFLQPLVTSIPLQLLAYEIALLRGCNVDRPRNLAKSVTVE